MLVLVAIAVYEGLQWSQPLQGVVPSGMSQLSSLFWSLDCLHALLVVVVCTMPDLLLQRISNLMAASRVMSLVISLLIVTVGGLYLLHLKVLTNVLKIFLQIYYCRFIFKVNNAIKKGAWKRPL